MREAFIEWVHETRPGLVYYGSVLLRVSRHGDYLFTYWSDGTRHFRPNLKQLDGIYPLEVEHTFRVSDFLPYWRDLQMRKIGI